MKKVQITSNIEVGADSPLLLICGPCQIESRDHALSISEKIKEISSKYPLNFIYKSSFDKANRTSLSGKRGMGIDEGLKVLDEVKRSVGVPVLTDIHLPEQASITAEVVDVLQTPAFLCRQTDLLLAAGETGKPINVKKGQFLHPKDMQHVADKIASTGNSNIMLCERGTCFGYRDLIVDIRSIVMMQQTGYPVIFDATHSVQSMGGSAGSSGGNRAWIPPLAKAAIASGANGIFIECHENPDKAPSDAASMLPLSELDSLLDQLTRIRSSLIS